MPLNKETKPTTAGTPIGIINLGQSGPGSNFNEGLLLIPQSSRIGASSSDAVQCHTQDTSSILSVDRTITDTSKPGQSGPWSNVNEGLFHIPQSSRIGASSSDAV